VVKTVEEKSTKLTMRIQDTIKASVDIQIQKWNVKDQEKYQEEIAAHLRKIEKTIDKNADHCDSLQNWMDIYMPMRI
jgi:hypothetical protein